MNLLQILGHYWGIVAGVVVLGVWALLDWKNFRQNVAGMILFVEKNAETLLIDGVSGEAKHQWVVDQTYPLLPAWLKAFITKDRYHLIVENIFQWLLSVAKKHQIAATAPVDKPPDTPLQEPVPAEPAEQTSPAAAPGAPDQPAAGAPPTE